MSDIRFQDTYSKRVETFQPMEEGKVKMYTCGPTVYSYPHIGNFRSFVFADMLKRFFQFRGFQVTHVMNITDVGHLLNDADEGADRIEEEARKQQKNPLEIANFYIDSFMEANLLLNIRPATHYPRATDHIPEMIDMIKVLINKGYAYVVGKNVYYDVKKFSNYGKLSGNTIENLCSGARVEINDEKRCPRDFALWKHDPNHLQQWDSPWGKGFPGWHIECSAMSSKYLGPEFDIHTGGEDNIFPHHECEIAQSEAASGRRFVHYWIHPHFLLVDGEKMAKSKNNFYTIQELVKQGFRKNAIRYALLVVHYRQNFNFTFKGLRAAEQSIDRIEQFVFVMKDIVVHGCEGRNVRREANSLIERRLKEFDDALSDDLNISKALSVTFDFIKEANKIKELNSKEAHAFISTIEKMDNVFGVLERPDEDVPEDIKRLAGERIEARQKKNWKRADEIRSELLSKGYVVEDVSGGGFRIKRKGGS